MKVTVFDYGAGNLHSLIKAVGRPVEVEADPARAVRTDVLLLAGVGAFPAAAKRLAPGREVMRKALAEGLPCLGVCLGMQLLFESSEEGEGDGLGLLKGRVTRLKATRVPHIGWNEVEADGDERLRALPIAYYANSFACRPEAHEHVCAWSVHERDRFPAAVRVANTLGVQFHPEKSSAPGVRFLRAFLAEVER